MNIFLLSSRLLLGLLQVESEYILKKIIKKISSGRESPAFTRSKIKGRHKQIEKEKKIQFSCRKIATNSKPREPFTFNYL